MIIAIDGPAGSGKSTLARALALQLDFAYLDTGAMYRCAAIFVLRRLGDVGRARPDAIAALAPQLGALRIELRGGPGGGAREPGAPLPGDRPAGDGSDGDGSDGDRSDGNGSDGDGAAGCRREDLGTRVLLDGSDVTEAIRTPEVSEMASVVASDAGVRQALVAKQRELLAEGDWVAEGRDIGTVVAPDAQVKVFLTAQPQERARRRAVELGGDPKQIQAEQAIRDARDSEREHSPLQAAAGAVTIDTTGLSIEDVVERVAALARDARTSQPG